MFGGRNIDKVGIFTSDFEKSVTFYRDVLRLEPAWINDDKKDAGFNAGHFILVIRENPREASAGGARLYFTVDRISYLRDRLFEAKVPVASIEETEMGRMVDFSDPDGNRLGLFRPSAQYTPQFENI